MRLLLLQEIQDDTQILEDEVVAEGGGAGAKVQTSKRAGHNEHGDAFPRRQHVVSCEERLLHALHQLVDVAGFGQPGKVGCQPVQDDDGHIRQDLESLAFAQSEGVDESQVCVLAEHSKLEQWTGGVLAHRWCAAEKSDGPGHHRVRLADRTLLSSNYLRTHDAGPVPGRSVLPDGVHNLALSPHRLATVENKDGQRGPGLQLVQDQGRHLLSHLIHKLGLEGAAGKLGPELCAQHHHTLQQRNLPS